MSATICNKNGEQVVLIQVTRYKPKCSGCGNPDMEVHYDVDGVYFACGECHVDIKFDYDDISHVHGKLVAPGL